MDEKERVKKWRDEDVYPVLKKYDLLFKSSNISWMFIVVLSVLIISGTMYYISYKGYLRGYTVQNITVTPIYNNSNDYQFTPNTQNEYKFQNNYTIVNNVTIPSNLCNCS